MAKDSTNLASSGVTALVGAKTITSVKAYKHGVVNVLEFKFSDASTNYIKIASNGGIEIGGSSAEMGTGTAVTF